MIAVLVLVTLLLFAATRRGSGIGGCCWCSGGWFGVLVLPLMTLEELPMMELVTNMFGALVGVRLSMTQT